MPALGSLFDGIGVFPLAASRCGITPLWASEIERAPVSITRRHFPDMEHLGDVTKLDGGKIPPVDIITFGSPCQNLSTAGNREGLAGVKSGLFFEAIRIIKEMRCETNGVYPTFAVWENVAGAFSSNDGMDFRAVLEAFTGAAVSMPAGGRWASAGMVRGMSLTSFGASWTPEAGAFPSGAGGSSLWQIMEDSVAPRYYLNPAACTKYLNMAKATGCRMPSVLENILVKQGGKLPRYTRSRTEKCGEPSSTKMPARSSPPPDGQTTLAQLF